MYCICCGASIPEIDNARTCYACGEVIEETPEADALEVLEQERWNSLLDSQAAAEADLGDTHSIFLAREEREGADERHPSTGELGTANTEALAGLHAARSRIGPPKFFEFGVCIGGAKQEYWVRASSKSHAVESLLAWIGKQGWRIQEYNSRSSEESPWGLEGQEFRMKQKREVPLLSEQVMMPGNIVKFIDAHGEHREDPTLVPAVRT